MRSIVARVLRSTARNERSGEAGVNDRDLIHMDNSGSVVNTPHSVRRLYLFLKARYKKIRAGVSAISWGEARKKGLVVHHKARGHGQKADPKPQQDDRIMAIQKPLNFILQHCPPSRKPNGAIDKLHATYATAQRAAARGDGKQVKRMAAQFLPA